MLQNIKNFLIAFLVGLIVFGGCALFVLYIIRGNSQDTADGNDNSAYTYEPSQDDTAESIDEELSATDITDENSDVISDQSV